MTPWTQRILLIIYAKSTPLLQAFLFASLPLLIFISASFCLAAETTPLDRLLSDIQKRVDTTQTVQCTFEQERNLSIFSQPILFTGKMELSRPDKLRWENLTPIPSVLIFAGDKGIRCNDDALPVHFELEKDPMMKMIAEQIWTWVNGNYAQMSNKYNITLSDAHEIELVPQSGELISTITSVKVSFDSQSLQPETIHIQETEGDSTTIRFVDYRLNQSVDDTLFSACYP
jgi:outer membrane lipoprotein-sorting protein